MDEFILTDENYHSADANKRFMSFHNYQMFTGTLTEEPCEAKAMAIFDGNYKENENNKAFLVGGYVDAYFEGTLEKYQQSHPEIFLKDGKTLKADYRQAELMIARCTRDKKFMQYMSGKKQEIMTADFFGTSWKIKIDSYLEGKAIVDLKTSADFHKITRVRDAEGNLYPATFIDVFGYDKQLAIYQKVVEINTGKKLRCYIAVVDKNDNPNIEVIEIDQDRMDRAMEEIKANMPAIIALRNHEIEPTRCNSHTCEYCKMTKVIERPISIDDLLN